MRVLKVVISILMWLLFSTTINAQVDASKQLRVLVIGAHPDDPDQIGGLIAMYAESGYKVKLVSMTNGDAGHHEIGGRQLALRRAEEARYVE